MSLRIAMLSVHTCPLAVLGGKETGGMNVYVRELSRELGGIGAALDIFTRSQNPAIPRVVQLVDGVRVVHLPAGAHAPMEREKVFDHLDEFIDGVDAWRMADEVEYDLVHGHYWLSGAVALELRSRWSVPVVQMFHTLGRLKNAVAGASADVEPALRIAQEGRIIAGVDRIVAATTVERDHLVEHYAADPARIAVVPCGVDTALFTPTDAGAARLSLGLGPEPLLLYVGRIAPIKGLQTLLDAMARLRAAGSRLKLLIVGGDADEPLDGHEADLRRRLDTLGLGDTVRFVGAQPQERLRAYYVAADATVLPSYYESFGMVALEAMACGRPVIASRVGGLQTTVRDGVTGLLVPEHDAAALAATVDRLTGDPALRWRLGREGVRWAARHRWPCVAESIVREYAGLVDVARSYVSEERCP